MGDFYEGRIFRPPSEAYSLIVQSTIGCSHNRCAFCTMYKEKQFRIRSTEDVIADLERARGFASSIKRIFFADGDAFIRKSEEQLKISAAVRRIFPECERVSMYASPKSVLIKTDDELKALAATGTGVAHCPISNMKLSSGVCRVPEMLRLGVPVGLAVDGAASNDGSNLLEELRVCYLLHRLQSSQSAPTGYDILKLATRGSARLLGRDDIGCLAAGMAADCFLISLDRIELAGAQFDPLSLLGTVGLKGPVDYTIVNGVAVVQNGELVTADEGELAARANAAVCRYLGRC